MVALWDFPALPPQIGTAVERTWRLRIENDPGASSPLALPGFAAAFAPARSTQLLRALAHRTNLVLPGARILVVGDGPLADALSTTLSRMGSRIVRAVNDPVTRLRAALAGAETHSSIADVRIDVDEVIATGEGHPPLDPRSAHGVLLDASPDGRALLTVPGSPVRPHVRRVDGGATHIVDAPAVFPPLLDEATALDRHLVDLFVALSLLRRADPTAADTELARLVLA